ncbi:MAG TPA: glutamate--tRNA ligase [Kofleriaceae bacterium]|jgi:glutamyl-tRNA synthetase|nr:glutamate--tRNA ligase [Kofleriaceae bacterium]
MAKVRVRIAPSPTGDPHVGTAYIALFNYAFARQQGGQFVLRIEDTDQTRARGDSEQMIFDALHWLGLDWDEGPDVGGPHAPYRQSERSAIYQEHARILLDKGEAYRCFCTADRLAKLRLQQDAEKSSFKGYDRHCRDIARADGDARAQAEPFVIRLKMPIAGEITFRDELRGDVTREANNFDDQVLLKSDGLPTYHLANVVDDHLMEITHVVRAEEWISSAGKHAVLYAAFGWEPPKFFHMPLLRNSDKSKISKRKNPVSINYYRDTGILPQALLNFLGTMGWSFGGDREKFSLAEMIDVFSWDRIALGGPVFDLQKLSWLNEQYIHAMSDDELADALVSWRLNKAFFAKLVPLVRQRIKKLDDVIPLTEYFFSGDLDYAPIANELKVDGVANADLKKALLEYVEQFEARDGWTVAMLEDVTAKWLEAHGWHQKQAWPILRLAISGRKATPPLFETMVVLGKEITRRRLRRAAEWLGSRK